jgi:hypothetical protein
MSRLEVKNDVLRRNESGDRGCRREETREDLIKGNRTRVGICIGQIGSKIWRFGQPNV